MILITRTLFMPINPDRLLDDLKASLPVTLVDLLGYEPETDRKHVVRSSPYIYSRTLNKDLTAVPGAIHITATSNLTAQEIVDLDGILAAHDYTILSDSQVKEDDDLLIIGDLKATIAGGGLLTLGQLTSFVRIVLEREA